MKIFSNPEVRLFLRALLVGVSTFVVSLNVDTGGHVHYSQAGLYGCIVSGFLAFAEVFTPLNSLVGVFKGPAAATGAKS